MPRHRSKGVRRVCVPALGLATALAAAPAWAEGRATCALSATPLVFGQYVPYEAAPADFTATITVTCTSSDGAPAPIHGSISLTRSGGLSDRELTDGPHRLRYQLFLDPSRTTPWGDGGGGAVRSFSGIASAGAPFKESITVYARILARQSGARVGHYTGHIAVVLNY
ncbi:spore coat U domain-containing protein [Caulobacter sp. UNC279MFTsu5.1]|uniref:Csu type fimbrial protein n=1 Tax=Caulobacter sp. UNC279MFTsu5.1 TaxID=1502775 RepID=UPI0008ED2CE1|nr:spore coat U domain-containing protein [Caulobacter sp. UNC279MFTsu5.1]SFK68020.1 Spore coat protein U (SCPU) domain-containing protein [Caulobacter sp. UNC279MFTsu5.1]